MSQCYSSSASPACLPSLTARTASPLARPPADPAKQAEEALERLDANNVGQGPVDADFYATAAAQAPPERAIPVLERFYEKHKDDPIGEDGLPPLRDKLASLLVQLGDPNPVYWNLLVSEADLALSSQAPFPAAADAKTWDDLYTPEQKAWAKAHNISVDQMSKEAMLIAPGRLVPLARSGDPRALPILRSGLKSENPMIQDVAAAGLAILRDKDSIPVIIAISRARQGFDAHFIAENLMFFHDATADKVYHEYFPEVNIEQARQFRGDNPFCCVVLHNIPSGRTFTAPPRFSAAAADSSPAPPPQTLPAPDTAHAAAPGSPAGSPAGVNPPQP